MEDSLSLKSNDSLATSEEFDFIPDKPTASTTPTLDIAHGDMDELCETLKEVLQEKEASQPPRLDPPLNGKGSGSLKVGKSMFYDDCQAAAGGGGGMGDNASVSPVAEKQDQMKPEFSESEEEMSDVDQECTIFSGVTYLGSAAINAPKSEGEIKRNMSILNEQSSELGIKVSVSVPSSSQGVVVLYDASTNAVIARYEINRIVFYARGAVDSDEVGCFAFTWSHGETQESAIFQCHVFKCDIPEAVNQVSACFAKAFQRAPRSMSTSVASISDMGASITTLHENLPPTMMYAFEVSLEIKEDDGKGTFSTVPKDRSGFKMRVNLEKQLFINVRKVSDSGPFLCIERCFGVLVAPGRHVKHSDMRLLEMILENNAGSYDQHVCSVSAKWNPKDEAFQCLNMETKDIHVFITVAVDLVIRGMRDPIRFLIETPVKFYGQNERFWYFSRRVLVQEFYLNLKEVVLEDQSDVHYKVLSMETSGELDRNRLNLSLNLSSLIRSPSINSLETLTPKEDNESDGDEPLLSGTGCVSKDCSEDVLESWADVLSRWKSTHQRPRQLASLVRHGIPEALRGEVWERLANTEDNQAMMDTYRILISKESSCENVIQRDIARTFPAHDFFKEVGGLGQDSLYRVSKAYAVYDEEVGYCQGLSFLAATLLLHMPEEQTFCVLVKLMYDYGLRDLYKDGFENLYLRLYQLNRLMEEQLAPLWQHFIDHHVETHMFASQWFLTLFTAKFPLHFVFHIIDVFLLQGINTIFQIALALLMMCKKDLLQLDFEGILKYFRVTLPKKCRTEEAAKHITKLACSLKVKKLKKYEQDFIALKAHSLSPLQRLGFVTSKRVTIVLFTPDSEPLPFSTIAFPPIYQNMFYTDEAQDKAESFTNELESLRTMFSRCEEERKLLSDEVVQLKDMLKREVLQADVEAKKSASIIHDYKQICQRLDAELTATKAEMNDLKAKVSSCDTCKPLVVDCSQSDYVPVVAEGVEPTPEQRKAAERIRELELELAHTKLKHVEAECKNQDLTHQLNSTVTELSTSKHGWAPWLSKTLSSIKEVANKKDLLYMNQSSGGAGATFISHINPVLRDNSFSKTTETRKSTALKDSQSFSSLRSYN